MSLFDRLRRAASSSESREAPGVAPAERGLGKWIDADRNGKIGGDLAAIARRTLGKLFRKKETD